MDKKRQLQAPIYSALERFRKQRVVPFDVPGHKRGRGNPELVELLGEKCVGIDVNSMKPLDNLCHPVSVIKEAEELAADAFGAAHAFLMVGGTTSSVQSMVLSACKAGDKIILPRNVHKSVINALVVALCMKKQKEVVHTLETLEQIWGEYQVYSKDELNQVDDTLTESSSGKSEENKDE